MGGIKGSGETNERNLPTLNRYTYSSVMMMIAFESFSGCIDGIRKYSFWSDMHVAWAIVLRYSHPNNAPSALGLIKIIRLQVC